jgi:hypothetical protein
MVLASAGFAACRIEEKIEREAMKDKENVVKSFMERMIRKMLFASGLKKNADSLCGSPRYQLEQTKLV